MNDFRDRLIYLLQTVGQLEGRADDVADAIIEEFGFFESQARIYDKNKATIIGWMSDT